MNYAVLHVEKGSSSSGGLGNHIDRIPGKEHSYKNANLDLLDKNRRYAPTEYCKMPLARAIEARISDGYKTNRKLRSNAVKFCKVILSGSHKKMKDLQKDPKKFEQWVRSNYSFAAQQWGAENIVRFTLHLDEKTPHIHCVFVPLTKDGRLTARDVVGNKKDLEALQDNYAIAMDEFGFKRGLRGSKAKHEDISQYYGRVTEQITPITNDEAFNALENSIEKPTKTDFLNREAYLEKQKKAAKNALKKVLDKKDKELKRLKGFEIESARLKHELAQSKGHLDKLKHDFGPLLNEPEFKLKATKGQLVFSSGTAERSYNIRPIVNGLNSEKLKSSMQRNVQTWWNAYMNSKYQGIKHSPEKLLTLSPNEIKDVAEHIVRGSNGHTDETEFRDGEVRIGTDIRVTHQNDAISLSLEYRDPYANDELKKFRFSINRNIEKEDIVAALTQAQHKAIREQSRGKGKGRGMSM